jgi:heparan-alpha-glucosaminide N-acetyltransferase
MSTLSSSITSSEASVQVKPARVASIDILRGITMAVMIFVNALSSVPGLPWWTYHAHENQDLMTYVDMVFPCFLFIVGMSMPIALKHRLKRDSSVIHLWMHVFTRFVSLVGVGLILANAEKADPSRMPVNGNVWALIGLISAALFLNVYPKSVRFPSYAIVLKAIGILGVIYTYAIFRRSIAGGSTGWIDPSYPEILGLIGFSYLVVSILYIPTRRMKWAPTFWFLLLLAFNICSTAKLIPLPGRMPIYEFPLDNGAMASIIMAGVLTSQLFVGAESRIGHLTEAKITIFRAIGLAVLMLVAGAICMPLGISKIRATPTWSLWSIGASMLLFTLLYWICDVKGKTSWASVVKSAGSNTLLTYLLPDVWYFFFAAVGFTYLDTHINLGWPAVVKTVLFTLVILGLSSLLTRARLRLQL